MSDLRIYVACLASYNNGVLHGAWIDCDGKDKDDIQDEINTVLRTSRFPNVMVHDPERAARRRGWAPTGKIQPSGYMTWQQIENGPLAFAPEDDWDRICSMHHIDPNVPSAEEYAIHDHEGFGNLLGEYSSLDRVDDLIQIHADHEDEWDAFVSWAGCADNIDYDEFQDAYKGEYDSFVDYATELFDECYLHDVPQHVQNYIDYHSFARDLEHDGYNTERIPTGGVWVFGP